jgi:hypothetical protein
VKLCKTEGEVKGLESVETTGETSSAVSSSKNNLKDMLSKTIGSRNSNGCATRMLHFVMYCYMCEVSLVVALALLQQCNSTTLLYFLSYATILGG